MGTFVINGNADDVYRKPGFAPVFYDAVNGAVSVGEPPCFVSLQKQLVKSRIAGNRVAFKRYGILVSGGCLLSFHMQDCSTTLHYD